MDTSVDFGTGYTNTGKIIEIWNKNGEGDGSYTGAIQHDYDIFKHIQEEYTKGWFIPSKGEWAAFANYLVNKKENSLTYDEYDDGNYDDVYGLEIEYWTSSQKNNKSSWVISFYVGLMIISDVYGRYSETNSAFLGYAYNVRLSTTF